MNVKILEIILAGNIDMGISMIINTRIQRDQISTQVLLSSEQIIPHIQSPVARKVY